MVEWSRDLYSNPHVVKNLNNSNNGNNNMTHNNSEAELQSLVQDNLSIQNDDPLEYEKVKQHKHVLEDGIRLFNHKPAKGIKYFVDRNIIEDSLESRAAFLHENQRLILIMKRKIIPILLLQLYFDFTNYFIGWTKLPLETFLEN